MTLLMEPDAFFIGGRFVAPHAAGRLHVISPSTEESIGSVPRAVAADIDAAVAAAREAFDHGPWPYSKLRERAAVMLRLADELSKRGEELAQLITAEMGSPISFSRVAQVSSQLLGQYAAMADHLTFDERRPGQQGELVVRREPVGVAALIIPWNAPMGLLLGKLAPALLAGCTIVVKPAPQTPLDKVSFTGSTPAGKRIMSLCGEQVKRVTLELGGKSANIILEDADLQAAIPYSLQGGMLNNGEACIALTRVLAPRSRYEEVVESLAAGAAAMAVGDPFDEGTMIGPLASAGQRERVESYLASGREAGARVVTGGGRPEGLAKGWYVEPTVFADVDNQMRIAREEIFGPVLCVIAYDGQAEAIAIANDSPYGLCGAVWTADVERGLEVARRVRTGTYNINGFSYDTTAPFGGFKQSGLGREWGREGLDAYLEYKTIALPPKQASEPTSEPAGAQT